MAASRIAIIGLGSSLTEETLQAVSASDMDTFVINELFQWLPKATYHYAADKHWWDHYGQSLTDTYKGISFTLYPEVAKAHKATLIYGEDNPHNSYGGLRKQWLTGYHGGSSTHMAGNLAYHLGYEEQVWLGCDCKPGHFLKPHQRPGSMWVSSPYQHWARNMEHLYNELVGAGTKVYNATPDSAINIPYTPLEDLL